MRLTAGMRIDAQSIRALKDEETSHRIDYFFIANFWCKDPRYEDRFMLTGECRGLLRFDKQTLEAELLHPMLGDDTGSRFNAAASKVLREFRSNGYWPKEAQYASG